MTFCFSFILHLLNCFVSQQRGRFTASRTPSQHWSHIQLQQGISKDKEWHQWLRSQHPSCSSFRRLENNHRRPWLVILSWIASHRVTTNELYLLHSSIHTQILRGILHLSNWEVLNYKHFVFVKSYLVICLILVIGPCSWVMLYPVIALPYILLGGTKYHKYQEEGFVTSNKFVSYSR